MLSIASTRRCTLAPRSVPIRSGGRSSATLGSISRTYASLACRMGSCGFYTHPMLHGLITRCCQVRLRLVVTDDSISFVGDILMPDTTFTQLFNLTLDCMGTIVTDYTQFVHGMKCRTNAPPQTDFPLVRSGISDERLSWESLSVLTNACGGQREDKVSLRSTSVPFTRSCYCDGAWSDGDWGCGCDRSVHHQQINIRDSRRL